MSQKTCFALLEDAYDLVLQARTETSFHACMACEDESDSGRSSSSKEPSRPPPVLEPHVIIDSVTRGQAMLNMQLMETTPLAPKAG